MDNELEERIERKKKDDRRLHQNLRKAEDET